MLKEIIIVGICVFASAIVAALVHAFNGPPWAVIGFAVLVFVQMYFGAPK